jgi:L-threonylcarbamoyladenylate synthase
MSLLPDRSTLLWPASEDAVRQAADILRRGGLVVFPTETVYGLGADAENPAAVRAMFAAKGRPPDHPVIVHLAHTDLIDELAAEVPALARQLAAAFWPGPMTLIVRRNHRVSDLVTGGLETVGLRVPGHPVAQALLSELKKPLAAPSANRFGRVSPTRAEHVLDELAGRVDVILDGGPCHVGLESTIIDVSGAQPAVLRPGAITPEQIASILGTNVGKPHAAAPRVPGSLPSHYAPRASVEIVPALQLLDRAGELAAAGRRVAVIAREPLPIQNSRFVVLQAPANDSQFAHLLYALLRRADAMRCDVILTSLPEGPGLAAAIADRLRRAAGSRVES